MTKTLLFFRQDALLIYRRGIHADLHQHHGIQLTFAVNNRFEAVIDARQVQHRALVIDSDYPHRVVGQNDWVATLLLNPETRLAKTVLAHVLGGASFKSLDVTLSHRSLNPNLADDLSCEVLDLFLNDVSDVLQLRDKEVALPDPRIAKLLEIVGQLPDYRIGAKELSKKVYLSESRLGHLFKTQVGIPLRRYLLWSRLMLASQIVAQGENYTFAAHEAGFTDSAHLGRTFYTMFGLRLSDMFRDRQMTRVIFCDQ